MRNRDLPAGAVPGEGEGIRVKREDGRGADFVPFDGLTKREAAAIAIRAGLEASNHGPPMVQVGDFNERRLTSAEHAVREADALFDELEKADG